APAPGPTGPASAPDAPAADPAARPAPLQDIAAAIGCTPSVSVEAEEVRQGGCETPGGTFRIMTFAAERGRQDWLAEARAYGGTYLVGDRWIVTARPETALAPLRDRLGGSLESGEAHDAGHATQSPHPSHAPAPGPDPSHTPGPDPGQATGHAPGHG
ncbi:hypothetical protein GPJ59_33105, partial [Streptomyces bambusae]|nr:hypothetical protein [Streptomyces bambusae]